LLFSALLCPMPAVATDYGGVKCPPEQYRTYGIETLVGTMKEEPRPNPRYEEGYDNGEEKFWNYWFLYLDEPICLPDNLDIVSNPDIDFTGEEEHDVKVMQLGMMDGEIYKKRKDLLGKRVVVTGELDHSQTQYHLTKILIFVKDPDDIKPVR